MGIVSAASGSPSYFTVTASFVPPVPRSAATARRIRPGAIRLGSSMSLPALTSTARFVRSNPFATWPSASRIFRTAGILHDGSGRAYAAPRVKKLFAAAGSRTVG
jgi:hypothetical protein